MQVVDRFVDLLNCRLEALKCEVIVLRECGLKRIEFGLELISLRRHQDLREIVNYSAHNTSIFDRAFGMHEQRIADELNEKEEASLIHSTLVVKKNLTACIHKIKLTRRFTVLLWAYAIYVNEKV